MKSRRTLTYFQSAFEVIVRAPQTRMPRPGKLRMTLTPFGLRTSCIAVVDVVLEVERAAHRLVGRRLEHAALGVGARVDAEHVAAGRHELARARLRVGSLDPRVVERGVLRCPGCRFAGPEAWARAARSRAHAKRNFSFSQ